MLCFSDMGWGHGIISGNDCSTHDFGSVDEVKLNKSRNIDVRKLDESVL